MFKARTLARQALMTSVVCFVMAIFATAAHAQKVCHLLIIADTNDRNIGPSVGIDAYHMKALFEANVARKQLRTYDLTGDSVNKNGILNKIAQVNRQMSEQDTLIVYFSGHGAYDTRLGQYIQLSSRENVLRSDLLSQMNQKDVRLKILLTDTCSVIQRFEAAPSEMTMKIATENSPAFAELCWKPSGTVDISGSDIDEIALGDNLVGGYFTHQLTTYLKRNSSRPLNWITVARNVRDNTAAYFKSKHPGGRYIKELNRTQRSQTVSYRIDVNVDEGSGSPPAPTPLFQEGPRLGVRVVNSHGRGVLIKEVVPRSPATNVTVSGIGSGVALEPGDRLISINGRPIHSESDFARAVDNSGQRMSFEVLNSRDGRTYSATVQMRY